MYSFLCVLGGVGVGRGREGGRERGRKWEERGGVQWCVAWVMQKSLFSLVEQALLMISKAEELKCLSSTFFFFFKGLKFESSVNQRKQE